MAYIIPQGWWRVIELLQLNKVELTRFKKDTSIEVEVYHIENYKSSATQYEMHHSNRNVTITSSMQK